MADLCVTPGGGGAPDARENDRHELYFICEDIDATLADLAKRTVPVSPVTEERWGRIASLTLPGGGRVGVYPPKHASLTP